MTTFGNTDCPICGGYGHTVPDSMPPGAYEQVPCPECCCVCGKHAAAGEVCLGCEQASADDREYDAAMDKQADRDARRVA